MAHKPSGVSSIGDRLPDTVIDLFGREGIDVASTRHCDRGGHDDVVDYPLLYSGVIGRLMDHLSSLIVRFSRGHCDAAQARLKTLAIVGQALVFRVARTTLLRATGSDRY